eukprot:UC1_evm6s2112
MPKKSQFNPRQSAEERSLLRKEYTQQLNHLEKNQHDFSQPGSLGPQNVLTAANNQFKTVAMTREAAMDASVLSEVSKLSSKQASRLKTTFEEYDSVTFMSKLVGILRDDGGGGWHHIARLGRKHKRHAVAVSFINGPLNADKKKREVKRAVRSKVKFNAQSAVRPTTQNPVELAKGDGGDVEAVQNAMDCLTRKLESLNEDKYKAWVYYYDLVIDPSNFSRSVENVFSVSFLAFRGLIGITPSAEHGGRPIVRLTEPVTGDAPKKHVIVNLDHAVWRNAVRDYNISSPIIQPLSTR